MVEKLPEHAHHDHTEQHQEAVLVLIAEWRVARQDGDDDQSYEAADHREQENPGLYAASQGRNHASTCPYRIPVGSTGIICSLNYGCRLLAQRSHCWTDRPGQPGFPGKIRGEPGRR